MFSILHSSNLPFTRILFLLFEVIYQLRSGCSLEWFLKSDHICAASSTLDECKCSRRRKSQLLSRMYVIIHISLICIEMLAAMHS